MTPFHPMTCLVAALVGWMIPHAGACSGPSSLPAGSTLAGQGVSASVGRDAIGNAIAGPLVAALSEQLGGRPVDMSIDGIDGTGAATAPAEIAGTGSLRLQGQDEWMGFRFRVLYDGHGAAGFPNVVIGGVAAGEKDVPNDGRLVQALDDKVVDAIRSANRTPSVRLQLDTIRTVEAGRRYLRINASGLADFGPDGTSDAQLEGLYDRFSGEWLRVHYDVGRIPAGAARDVPIAQR